MYIIFISCEYVHLEVGIQNVIIHDVGLELKFATAISILHNNMCTYIVFWPLEVSTKNSVCMLFMYTMVTDIIIFFNILYTYVQDVSRRSDTFKRIIQCLIVNVWLSHLIYSWVLIQ